MVLDGVVPQHLLGLLAQTMGDYRLAEEHFEQALAFCRNAAYRSRLAWACYDYADCLLQRSSTAAVLDVKSFDPREPTYDGT